jgi:hypothetical protein
MNATYNIDHVQAVAHATSLLKAGATLGDTATVSKPKTATTSHYDPTGQQVATTSNTSYANVNFASDGSVSGGTLTHVSSIPGGNNLSTTSVGFGTNGKPQSANITVHNNDGQGDFRKIQMDMTSAVWNNSLVISSGSVNVTALDATSGQKLHDGSIVFNNETVASGAFTHYATDGGGAVKGSSQLDYSAAKFLGNNIVGGQYTINTQSADNTSKSTSVVTVSELGRVQSIETTNQGGGGLAATATPTNTVSSKVSVDCSKVQFNARNEFASGEITYTAKDDKGALLSTTTVAYKDANPSLSTTSVYKDGKLQNKIVIDYSASRFNNDHKVVSSTKKVDTYSGDDKLLSSAVVAYDEKGNKVKGNIAAAIKATPPPKKAPPPASTPVNSSFKMTAVQTTDPGTTQQTDKTTRTDGTLEQVRVTTLKGNIPVAAQITLYAADGTTVVKTYTMDLSGLTYDPNAKTVSGALNMQSHTGGTVLNSESTIQY